MIAVAGAAVVAPLGGLVGTRGPGGAADGSVDGDVDGGVGERGGGGGAAAVGSASIVLIIAAALPPSVPAASRSAPLIPNMR